MGRYSEYLYSPKTHTLAQTENSENINIRSTDHQTLRESEHTRTHTHTNTHTHTHILGHTCIHTHARTHNRTNAHTHTPHRSAYAHRELHRDEQSHAYKYRLLARR